MIYKRSNIAMKQVDAAILGHCYDWNWDALLMLYFLFWTQIIAIAMHNVLLLALI